MQVQYFIKDLALLNKQKHFWPFLALSDIKYGWDGRITHDPNANTSSFSWSIIAPCWNETHLPHFLQCYSFLKKKKKHSLFSITWKHLCEPDFCMLRPTLFFRFAPFSQRRQLPPWRASTQWRHCTYSVKYQWCDAHSPCVGGVICQETSPGNYLLLFFASEGRCALPFSSARAKIAQPPPWIWRASATRQAEGQQFFVFFLHLLSPRTSIPPSRNRATWRHQSHLIWYVVFQSTSAEALWASRAAAKRRRRRRRKKEKHSLANGQKPGLECTDPVGQPFCRPFRCTLV